MRVLSISTLFPAPPRPGFGQFVANQMRAVVADGRVELVMLNPIGLPPWPLSRREPYRSLASCPPESVSGGVPVLHPRFTLIPAISATSNPKRIARAILPLVRRMHAQAPFDLVDAQFFFPDGPAAAIVARELALPLTIKARGSDIHYWSQQPRARAQICAAADQAARLLTVSAALGRDMAALGMDEARIVAHYTGLDRTRFHVRDRSEARAALPPTLAGVCADLGEAPLLVCPGALIAIKGQALAIEALADLPGAHLALAGKGADEAGLRALAAQTGVAERTHFLGQVGHDTLPLLMAAANAVVLPSQREGLANVWIEALACGTRLVIPDIGGAREVVTSPDAGRIAARSGAAIAQAVRELTAAPVTQDEVAATVADFSWEANASRLIGIWEEAVATAR
ncbi:MAG TPA: glycosyltransferase [Novosphingobium sp.]|nr:glycosyltransferase [Novosphingobium sp.]